MKTNNLYKNLTAKSKYLALCCALPVLMAACKQPEKYAECKELNKKIDSLSKEISATQNLRTARLPGHLRNTQSRYIDAADSVAQQSDTAQICLFQNDELWQEAFNNYAIRIGYDFQLSKFLPQSDIDIFKEQLANIFYDDFVCEMARERVLKDVGSLHDLSYFLEMMDIDSVNAKLQNKLDWKFYSDTVSGTLAVQDLAILEFANPEMNKALRAENDLLNRAWEKSDLQSRLKQNDSLRKVELATAQDSVARKALNNKYDSLKTEILYDFENEYRKKPNFDIPEFDMVRSQYLHNDSMISKYESMFNNMTTVEDSLEQYRQSMIRKRDSLISRRKELSR